MENFKLAASVVVPLLIYMLTGMVAKRIRIVREESLKDFNKVVFNILIPMTLFMSVYDCDLKTAIDLKLVVYIEAYLILTFIIAWFIIKRTTRRDLMQAATFAQGIYRSNIALFSLSVGMSLCDAAGRGMMSVLAVIVTPTLNILAVILFNSARNEHTDLGKIIIEIFKNPLVDASLLGILVNLSGIRLPELITVPFGVLGKCATPVALIALGGMITIKSFREHAFYIAVASAMRLVVIPAFAVLIGILLGFKGAAMVGIFAVFASPTSLSSTPMTQAMGGDVKLAGEIVAVTSVMSMLTIFLGIMLLSSLGLI